MQGDSNDQGYHAVPVDQRTLIAKVKWGDPATHRPVESFAEGEIYGLPTGPNPRGNDCWVLDLDRKNGKDGVAALDRWIAEHAPPGEVLPATYTVRTRNGGLHLYWAWDPQGPVVRNRRGVLGEESGIDVRGAGGLAYGGGPYEAEDPDQPMAYAPAWLVELVTSGVKEGGVSVAAHAISPENVVWSARVRMAEAFVAEQPPAIEGEGKSEQLVWKMALRLAHEYELPFDECERILEPWHARCSPAGYCRGKVRHALPRAAALGHGPAGTAPEGWAGPVATEDPTEKSARDLGAAAPGPRTWTYAQRAIIHPRMPDYARRCDPTHTYAWDIAVQSREQLHKVTPISDQEIIGGMTGESAHPEWIGVWQKDEFTGRVIAVNPPMRLDAEDGRLTQGDVVRVRSWYAHQGGKTSKEAVADAIRVAADACPTHSVRMYLAGLDPAPRTEWLRCDAPDGQGGLARRLFADDAPPAADVFVRAWLIGCVARAMKPGCQFDTILTLCGERGGERKSTFFQALAGDGWYRSNLPNLENPQLVGMAMRGNWIVEMGELAALGKAQVEAIKEFVTRKVEKFNEKYEPVEATEPRACGIAASTNRVEFLDELDSALRRRFWPIQVTKIIDVKWVREHRDEIWAEALAAYLAGEPWHFPESEALDEARAPFIEADPCSEQLAAMLAIAANRKAWQGKPASEIAKVVYGCPGLPTKSMVTQVGKALAKRAATVRDCHAKRHAATRMWYFDLPDAPGGPGGGPAR